MEDKNYDLTKCVIGLFEKGNYFPINKRIFSVNTSLWFIISHGQLSSKNMIPCNNICKKLGCIHRGTCITYFGK
jgi:hypothetical protein